MRKQRDEKQIFVWLTASNKGAAEVNATAASILGITKEMRDAGCAGDAKVDCSGICVKPGIVVRMTRNLARKEDMSTELSAR